MSSTTSPWRSIYQHVLRVALKDWGDARITLALDTTLLFKRWCVICVSLVYRGRALPLAWRVLRHGSSMVSNKEIYPVLASVQSLLAHLPHVEEVCINADRGFFDQVLMADFSAYGWHWNIRGKGQVYLFDAQGRPLGRFREQLSQHGRLVVRHNVYIGTAPGNPSSGVARLRCFQQLSPGAGVAQSRVQSDVVVPSAEGRRAHLQLLHTGKVLAEDELVFQRSVRALQDAHSSFLGHLRPHPASHLMAGRLEGCRGEIRATISTLR